jgi:hypothetical protein
MLGRATHPGSVFRRPPVEEGNPMTRIGQPDHGDHVTLWMIYTYLHDDVILYYNTIYNYICT